MGIIRIDGKCYASIVPEYAQMFFKIILKKTLYKLAITIRAYHIARGCLNINLVLYHGPHFNYTQLERARKNLKNL